MPTTTFTDPVPEGSSRVYTATLTDHAGTVIPLASVSALTLTLRDVASGTIVNSRDEQSVLNANGGTLHATSGLFTMVFSAADNAIVGSGTREKRRATFAVTYTDGAENHEVIYWVRNLSDV